MTDIKLYQTAPSGELGWDAKIVNGDLETEPGIETAILVSLFTDRRADINDDLPSDVTDLRGWWGDLVGGGTGYNIGSWLWLHERGKVTDREIALAQDRAEAALAWMIEEGVAMRVETEVDAIRENIIQQILAIGVRVFRKDGSEIAANHEYLWSE